MRNTIILFALSFTFLLSACGEDATPETSNCTTNACADTGETNTPDMGAAQDIGTTADMSSPSDMGSDAPDGDRPDLPTVTISATEANEADILYGWVAAGQPTESRVTEVVEAGAVVISLRAEAEDPFDEPGLVAGLGGTFVRYAMSRSLLEDMTYREGLYDLLDSHLDAGDIVYLHCASSNRVGASWAMYQAERKGVDGATALQMGADAGLSGLEPVVRDLLGL